MDGEITKTRSHSNDDADDEDNNIGVQSCRSNNDNHEPSKCDENKDRARTSKECEEENRLTESKSTIDDNDEDEEVIHKKKRRFVFLNESDDDNVGDVTRTIGYIESGDSTDSKRVKSEELAHVEPSSSHVIKSEEEDESDGEAVAAAAASVESNDVRRKVSQDIVRARKTKALQAQQKKEAEKESLKKFDTSDASYWPRVYASRRENSFNLKDLFKRECGQIRPKVFQDKAINNIDYVRRMKLTKTLKFHEGCVNALNFNRIGTLLCSGSDDYQVCIYDWARSRSILYFDSGHKTNVFQVKILFL